MSKLCRVRRGKLQAPPEKVEAWRREFDEVTGELFRRARGQGEQGGNGRDKLRYRQ